MGYQTGECRTPGHHGMDCQALGYGTSFGPLCWKKILEDLWNKIAIVELPVMDVCRTSVSK